MSPNQSNSNQDISDIDSAYCRATLYSALALGFRPQRKQPSRESSSRKMLPAGRRRGSDRRKRSNEFSQRH